MKKFGKLILHECVSETSLLSEEEQYFMYGGDDSDTDDSDDDGSDDSDDYDDSDDDDIDWSQYPYEPMPNNTLCDVNVTSTKNTESSSDGTSNDGISEFSPLTTTTPSTPLPSEGTPTNPIDVSSTTTSSTTTYSEGSYSGGSSGGISIFNPSDYELLDNSTLDFPIYHGAYATDKKSADALQDSIKAMFAHYVVRDTKTLADNFWYETNSDGKYTFGHSSWETIENDIRTIQTTNVLSDSQVNDIRAMLIGIYNCMVDTQGYLIRVSDNCYDGGQLRSNTTDIDANAQLVTVYTCPEALSNNLGVDEVSDFASKLMHELVGEALGANYYYKKDYGRAGLGDDPDPICVSNLARRLQGISTFYTQHGKFGRVIGKDGYVDDGTSTWGEEGYTHEDDAKLFKQVQAIPEYLKIVKP